MSTVSRWPSDPAGDELLVSRDLPAGWHLPTRSPGKGPEDISGELDAVLGYVDQTLTDEDPQAPLVPAQHEPADGRWRHIEHIGTKTRVYLRLQRQVAVPQEIRITGVVYLPGRPGGPITSHLLRELPTARIEAAINKRLFAGTRTTTIIGDKIALPSGRKVAERDLLNPPPPNRSRPPTSTSSSPSSTADSPRTATPTPPRPWPKSTASRSAPPKAG